MNTEKFLNDVRNAKFDLDIHTGKNGERQNIKDRKRIAIHITELAISNGLDVQIECVFFEARLYDLLKDTNLKCDPISHELKPKEQRFNDPLKLHADNWNTFMSIDFKPSYRYDALLMAVIDELTYEDAEEVKNIEESEHGGSVPPSVAIQWFY